MSDLCTAPSVVAERRRDGSMLLHSRTELGSYEARLATVLREWAVRAPDSVLVTNPSSVTKQ